MNKYILYIFVLFCISSCKEDAAFPEHTWYSVEIERPLVDAVGVNFKASISSVGDEPIIEKGFHITRHFKKDYWDYYLPDSVNETYPLSVEDDFYIRLETEWQVGVASYVQAYMKTPSRTFRSDRISFIPQGSLTPVITSVTPERGNPDEIITIKGKNFSSYITRNKVFIGDDKMEVLEATDSEMKVQLKNLYNTGHYDISLDIGGSSCFYKNGYYVIGPEIVSIFPEIPMPGEEVTMYLENISPNDNLVLHINGSGGYLNFNITPDEDNKVVFRFPVVEDDEDELLTQTSMYLREENKYLHSMDFDVQIRYEWEEIGKTPFDDDYPSEFYMDRNLGYIYNDNKLYEYNPKNNTWRDIPVSSANYTYSSLSFISGDYFYTNKNIEFGDKRFGNIDIETGDWSDCDDMILGLYSARASSVCINNEMYALVDPGNILLKYLIEEDEWDILDSNNAGMKALFKCNQGIYAFDSHNIFKLTLDNDRGVFEEVFSFPFYVHGGYYSYLPHSAKENTLYINSNGVVYGCDLKRNEVTVFGAPLNSYSVVFIFSFEESLIAISSGRVFKYIGSRY